MSGWLDGDIIHARGQAGQPSCVLETIWKLQDRTVLYSAAVIAGDLGNEPRAEILQHLADHYPQLRRVLVFGDQLEKLDHESSKRVHAVLRTPWRLKGLARALAVSGDNAVKTFDLLAALHRPDGAIDEEHAADEE